MRIKQVLFIKILFILFLLSANLFGAETIIGDYLKVFSNSLSSVEDKLSQVHLKYIGALSVPLLSLYFIYIGYRIIFKKQRLEQSSFIVFLLLPLLIAFTTNNNFFNEIRDAIRELFLFMSTDFLTTVLSVSVKTNPFDTIGTIMMDILMRGWNDVTSASWDISQIFIGLLKIFPALIILIDIAIIITRALLMQSVYFLILSFVLPTLAIPETRQIGVSVIKQLFSYSLHLPILSLVLIVFNTVLGQISDVGNPFYIIIFTLLASFALHKTFDQISEVANTLTGGQSSSSGGGLILPTLGALTASKLAKMPGNSLADKVGSSVKKLTSKFGKGGS